VCVYYCRTYYKAELGLPSSKDVAICTSTPGRQRPRDRRRWGAEPLGSRGANLRTYSRRTKAAAWRAVHGEDNAQKDEGGAKYRRC
jgi:hypothetical protein